MSGEKILVIDDSTQIREFLVEVLEPLGYASCTAENGKDGLAKALAARPDLIMLDLNLPDMSGLEVLESLRRRDCQAPVIMMTLYGSERVVVQALRLGVRDYLTKPFAMDELLAAIERALEERRLRQERERLVQRLSSTNRAVTLRMRELATLQAIGHSVASLMPKDQLLRRILDAAVYLAGADVGALFLLDRDTRQLRLEAIRKGATYRTGLAAMSEDSHLQDVLRSGKPVWITDPAKRSGMTTYLGKKARSLLYVPVKLGDSAIGVAGLAWMDGGQASTDTENRLVALADFAAIAINNALLFEETRRSSRELALLNRIIAASAASNNVESILEIACRELAMAFGVPQAAAAVFDDRKAKLILVAGYLAQGRPLSPGKTIASADNPVLQHLLKKRTSLIIEGSQNDPRLSDIRDLLAPDGSASLLLLPLIVDGDVEGCLGLAVVESRAMSPAEVSLASRVAEQVSGVLSRARLQEMHRQMEEQFHQAQKMEAIGRLAGGIAHDFNNLLTVIDMGTQFLKRGLQAEDPRLSHVKRVRDAGQRAAGLTRQLLAFSRQEIVEPQILDLNQVLGDLDRMLRRIIGEDVDLTLHNASDLRPVKIDPSQIEQVVINLAVNARDAMPTGGKLTIETNNVVLDEAYAAHHVEVEPGEYVSLVVSDNGVGMTDEVKARIFEPFFTTKEKGKGTGLGLATVFGIVKQSEGHIRVYSEPGLGTTFRIYLPSITAGRPVPSHPPTGDEVLARGSETLLLVEDEMPVQELTRDILVAQGYRVLTAMDGEEALQVAMTHEGPIHLLVTDVVMPRMSGRALADQLCSSRPDTRVLFVSGYTDDAIVRHGVLAKGVQFLSKPFGMETLARKVRAVLDA
jgi:signal transduction histidine kinase/DNA-binding response OmpR family regulator